MIICLDITEVDTEAVELMQWKQYAKRKSGVSRTLAVCLPPQRPGPQAQPFSRIQAAP